MIDQQGTECQLYRWVQRPDLRVDKFGNSHTGRPVCAGHLAYKCNSLQKHYPARAAEWEYDRSEELQRLPCLLWLQGLVEGPSRRFRKELFQEKAADARRH